MNEFIGRISKKLVFFPFSDAEFLTLAQQELCNLRRLSWERKEIWLEWNDAVVQRIKTGYSATYGARRNNVLEHLIEQLARYFLDRQAQDYSNTIYITEGPQNTLCFK